jgi:hypothetical protein
MMDPIECIAQRLVSDCDRHLNLFLEINAIIDSSETTVAALKALRAKAYDQYVDVDRLDLVRGDIGRLRRCIDSMAGIKRMARKVFVVNFFESDLFYVFNQEVSFSYACKMMSQIGPKLSNFSNFPTITEVMSAELNLACSARFLALDEAESDLLCLESMPEGLGNPAESVQPNSATTSI